MEIEGGRAVITREIPIVKFLAKRTGLAGEDDFDEAEADMIVDHIADFERSECVSNSLRETYCF